MANQVLQTTELLELVLLELPPLDVLLAQRVSTFWRNAIRGSTKLQKLLFFLPVEGAEGLGPDVSFDNPMLAPIFANLAAIANHIEFEANPVPEKYTRPEASWRLMLFYQPPTIPSTRPVYGQSNHEQGPLIPWPADHEGARLYDLLFRCKKLPRVGRPIVVHAPGDRAPLLRRYAQLEDVKWSTTSALRD